MASERDLELLDDYLANRLDAPARKAFEARLQQDAALRQELELQQHLISGIKKARTAELKAYLKSIPVPAAHGAGSAVAGKAVIWTAIVAIVGAGLYLYLTDEAPDQSRTSTPAEQEIRDDSNANAEQPSTDVPAVEQDEAQGDEPVVSEEPSSFEQPPVEAPSAVKKDEEAAVEKPAIEVLDPTLESEEEISGQLTDPNNAPRLKAQASIPVEINPGDRKYKFHYQFKDGKLFLYGPFETHPYEIMEFFSDDNKRTMFLYHADNYYLLKDDSERLRELTSIKDPALVKKLNDYRDQQK